MPDLSLARKVLQTEAAAVLALVDRLDDRFAQAVALVRDCKGRVIVTGMGKSGIICRKIAATLVEHRHAGVLPASGRSRARRPRRDPARRRRDRAVVQRRDRRTDRACSRRSKRLGAPLIAMTGDTDVDARPGRRRRARLPACREEACPMNLVPTASTTAMLALGDALAMTVLVEKGFKPEDFANLHPGGKLGKRLMRVEQLMHAATRCPSCSSTRAMRDVIYEMSRKGLGMTCVVDEDGRSLGIITDGDLRRKMADNAERPRAHGAAT